MDALQQLIAIGLGYGLFIWLVCLVLGWAWSLIDIAR